jgi:uncharacterized membrane protein YraQ (UPF0718 family)
LEQIPVPDGRLAGATVESLALARLYAREHVLLCLVPAFLIAGAISTLASQGPVLRYLGAGANKFVAYGTASVAGLVLAVCSCTVLPLFAGIYAVGAGLGPATTFLYSGPAISVLAVILTARVLGAEIGLARAVGAVVFAVLIGLLMQWTFRKDEARRSRGEMALPVEQGDGSLRETAILLALLVGILIFANFGRPEAGETLWYRIYTARWGVTAVLAGGMGVLLVRRFGMRRVHLLLIAGATMACALLFRGTATPPFLVATAGLSLVAATDGGRLGRWFEASWGFARQILPLLLVGILIAGLLLGRPGGEGLIPGGWVAGALGGNSPSANLAASVAGAFMYFATLTEVPILEGLMGSGMGQGPALALLLAGPAVSLPSLLVIRSVVGTRKTAVFVGLVVVMASFSGWIWGLMQA